MPTEKRNTMSTKSIKKRKSRVTNLEKPKPNHNIMHLQLFIHKYLSICIQKRIDRPLNSKMIHFFSTLCFVPFSYCCSLRFFLTLCSHRKRFVYSNDVFPAHTDTSELIVDVGYMHILVKVSYL